MGRGRADTRPVVLAQLQPLVAPHTPSCRPIDIEMAMASSRPDSVEPLLVEL